MDRVDLLQIAQYAQDLDRAAAFYTMLLGEPPIASFDPPGLAFFRVGGVRLLLDRGAPSALHYLQVSDVKAEVERLRVAGVEIVGEPHMIFEHRDAILGTQGTQEYQAFVRDSEGNLVGLVTLYPLSQ